MFFNWFGKQLWALVCAILICIACCYAVAEEIRIHSDESLGEKSLRQMGRKLYGTEIGHTCYGSFTAPKLDEESQDCKTCSTQNNFSKQIQNIASPTDAVLSEYEDQFFSGLAIKQKEESECLKPYLKGMDRRYSLKAREIQEAILKDLYEKLPKLSELYDRIQFNSRKLVELQSIKVAFENNSETMGMPIAPGILEDIGKYQQWIEYDSQLVQNIKNSIWAGNSPQMDDFVNYYIGRFKSKHLTKSQFLNEAQNPESGSSGFQSAVIEQMTKKNEARIKSSTEIEKCLKNSINICKKKPLIDENYKIDLVTSGAYLRKIQSRKDAKDFSAFACHLESVYGGGREKVYKVLEPVGNVAEVALVILSTRFFGGRGMVVSGAAATFMNSQVQIAKRGSCAGGLGTESVVNENLCADIRKLQKSNSHYSEEDHLQILSKDFKERSTCSQVQMSSAVGAFLSNIFGGGAKTKEAEALIEGKPKIILGRLVESEETHPRVTLGTLEEPDDSKVVLGALEEPKVDKIKFGQPKKDSNRIIFGKPVVTGGKKIKFGYEKIEDPDLLLKKLKKITDPEERAAFLNNSVPTPNFEIGDPVVFPVKTDFWLEPTPGKIVGIEQGANNEKIYLIKDTKGLVQKIPEDSHIYARPEQSGFNPYHFGVIDLFRTANKTEKNFYDGALKLISSPKFRNLSPQKKFEALGEITADQFSFNHMHQQCWIHNPISEGKGVCADYADIAGDLFDFAGLKIDRVHMRPGNMPSSILKEYPELENHTYLVVHDPSGKTFIYDPTAKLRGGFSRDSQNPNADWIEVDGFPPDPKKNPKLWPYYIDYGNDSMQFNLTRRLHATEEPLSEHLATSQSLSVGAPQGISDISADNFVANYRTTASGSFVKGVPKQQMKVINTQVEYMEIPLSNRLESYGIALDEDIRGLKVGDEIRMNEGRTGRIAVAEYTKNGIYHPPEIEVLNYKLDVSSNRWIPEVEAKFTPTDMFSKDGLYRNVKHQMVTGQLSIYTQRNGTKSISITIPNMKSEYQTALLDQIKTAQSHLPAHLSETFDELMVTPSTLVFPKGARLPKAYEDCGGIVTFSKTNRLIVKMDESGNLQQTTYWHEWAHALAARLNGVKKNIVAKQGDMNPMKEWKIAVKADGRSASRYADTNSSEDFAETVTSYIATDGGKLNPSVREALRSRYEILDKIFSPTFKLPPAP